MNAQVFIDVSSIANTHLKFLTHYQSYSKCIDLGIKYIGKAAALLILSLFSTIAAAQVTSSVPTEIEGRYHNIVPAQPTGVKDKVVITDIFWYGCPHCYSFLPALEKLEQNVPPYVELQKIPAIFNNSWENHARAYYTAKVLGVLDLIHRPLFEEIHEKKNRLSRKDDLREFFVSKGVSGEDFDAVYNSFTVNNKVKKAKQLVRKFGIRGTPAVIVNGKYRINGRVANGQHNMLNVALALARREYEKMNAANQVSINQTTDTVAAEQTKQAEPETTPEKQDEGASAVSE